MEPRPKITDAMKLEAAKAVAAKIDADPEIIAKHYRYPMDGYELAKELDRYEMWDLTRIEMEELDRVDFRARELIEKAEKEWFERNQPKPPFELGTQIKWRGIIGEITGIYEYGPAKYLVKPNDNSTGDGRYIVNFEDAKPNN